MLVLSVASLALSLFSLIHAALTKPRVFIAADKRTKGFWLIVTGIAVIIAFLSLPGGAVGRSLLLIILPLIAAGIYLTDVRPALKEYSKRGRGGGGSDGWRTW